MMKGVGNDMSRDKCAFLPESCRGRSNKRLKERIWERSCHLLICSQWLQPQRVLPELEVITPTFGAPGQRM